MRLLPPFAELGDASGYGIDPPPEGPTAQTSLQLLQAVYRNQDLPLPTRMRAATVAIAYEHAKLSVVGTVNHRGMGDMLDAAHAKQLEARRLAEPEPEPSPVASAPPAGASFRRIVPAPAEQAPISADAGPTLSHKPGRKR